MGFNFFCFQKAYLFSKKSNLNYTYEPTRHEPVTRAEPISLVGNNYLFFFWRFSQIWRKNTRGSVQHGVNRFIPCERVSQELILYTFLLFPKRFFFFAASGFAKLQLTIGFVIDKSNSELRYGIMEVYCLW